MGPLRHSCCGSHNEPRVRNRVLGEVGPSQVGCAIYCSAMSNSGEGSSRGQAALVQSVDRAVSVLEILARRGEAGVTELAGELGVHKSTAFRLVVALENRGLVEQVIDRGKYRLGFGVVRLASATAVQLDLSRESRAVCERLATDLGE